MAKRSNRQYAVALYDITKDVQSEKLDEVLEQFVLLLHRDHRLKQAGNILSEYKKYSKLQSGVNEIEIVSARKLDDTSIEKIKSAFGSKVEETLKTDESMIGGIKVRIGDKILDASISTQIKRLKSELN